MCDLKKTEYQVKIFMQKMEFDDKAYNNWKRRRSVVISVLGLKYDVISVLGFYEKLGCKVKNIVFLKIKYIFEIFY